MKYFEIQDTPELKYAPRLKNWYGKFDVRNIRLDSYSKLPKKQLFIIEPSSNTVFTDIILFPFLLISPMFREVVEMYRERCFFREIILLDQSSGESRVYYLPVLDETSHIKLFRKEYRSGTCIPNAEKAVGKEIYLDRNLFWVSDTQKRHIVLSMDMAESLIRRGVTGLGLGEVALYSNV